MPAASRLRGSGDAIPSSPRRRLGWWSCAGFGVPNSLRACSRRQRAAREDRAPTPARPTCPQPRRGGYPLHDRRLFRKQMRMGCPGRPRIWTSSSIRPVQRRSMRSFGRCPPRSTTLTRTQLVTLCAADRYIAKEKTCDARRAPSSGAGEVPRIGRGEGGSDATSPAGCREITVDPGGSWPLLLPMRRGRHMTEARTQVFTRQAAVTARPSARFGGRAND